MVQEHYIISLRGWNSPLESSERVGAFQPFRLEFAVGLSVLGLTLSPIWLNSLPLISINLYYIVLSCLSL